MHLNAPGSAFAQMPAAGKGMGGQSVDNDEKYELPLVGCESLD